MYNPFVRCMASYKAEINVINKTKKHPQCLIALSPHCTIKKIKKIITT